jgi:hypothetical protein
MGGLWGIAIPQYGPDARHLSASKIGYHYKSMAYPATDGRKLAFLRIQVPIRQITHPLGFMRPK